MVKIECGADFNIAMTEVYFISKISSLMFIFRMVNCGLGEATIMVNWESPPLPFKKALQKFRNKPTRILKVFVIFGDFPF